MINEHRKEKNRQMLSRNLADSGWRKQKQEYNRQFYAEHKGYFKERTSRLNKEKKRWVTELKTEIGCVVCEEHCAACLDFHHINPETKEDCVCNLARYSCSLEKVKEEIRKCIVLCANCHRKHKAGLISLEGYTPIAFE